MQSAEMNEVTKGRVNISHVEPRFWSTKALAVRGAMTLAVLSVLLLIAAHPALAQTESVLYNFNGNPDGANPQSRLTLSGGNLYGTTNTGGLGFGTVFELSPNGSGGWTETVLYSFTGGADGANPTYSYVTFDSKGNLYGTAYAGGADSSGCGGLGCGVVFELTPGQSGWTETVLHSFTSNPDGANPVNGLIMDKAGKLYGTTYAGGQGSNGGNGTVFQLTPSGSGWTEKVIANIRSTYSGLTMDSSGNIFGTTYSKVFKLSPNGNGWKWTVIYTFGSGSNPNGTPVLDSAGNLYGTTFAGGTYGNVYKLTPGNGGPWTKSILYAFSASSPNHPLAGVVFDSAGNLYGSTTQGGIHNDGNVFELVALGKGKYKFKVLQAFAGENGFQPFGSLILDSAGFVYGTTTLGGSSGNGIVFEMNANAIMTTCTLTSSPNPSNQGDTVTFTATVTPAPPDGELITFEQIAQAPLVGGQAVFTTSVLPVGYTRVRAIYFGDFDFYQSRSSWVYQHVK